MIDFVANLKCNSAIILRNCSYNEAFASDFAALAALLGGSPSPENSGLTANLYFGDGLPSGDWFPVAPLVSSVRGYWNRDEQSFRLDVSGRKRASSPAFLAWLGSLSLLYAVCSAMFRGHPVLLIHGALLETARGGVLLSGESGVGKSTTFRRWQEAGGMAYADDMVLLEELEHGRWQARPLPTWSRCAQSFEGLCFPVDHAVPLIGVLGLARSADDSEAVRPVSGTDFFVQLYSSAFMFLSKLAPTFPEAEQHALVDVLRCRVGKLTEVYPPRALFARLDGDLTRTLKEFL